MTNEPIINARFKKFRESYGLIDMADGDAFERFVNSEILISHQPDAFTADSDLLETICVGGKNDTGIDGIAIKLNGIFVKNRPDVNYIIKQLRKKIDIEFIFIQSKYKPNFDSGELNNFIAGVRNFLSENATLPMNDKVRELYELKQYLISEDIVYDWNENPTVRMYYVAMGKWRNVPHHLALADQAKGDISKLNIYEKTDIHFVDSDYLKTILDSNENKFSIIIETIATMELTPVKGVDNSCIAICKADEFSKMLTNEEGFIRKSLFEDNVRDYQGESAVNSEMFHTIKTDPSKFVLLNNGITIVCEDFTSSNRKLKIENPQIVNGCQTSHVIFLTKQQNIPISEVPLSIRIIATKDTEIANQVVRGTNKQNIVLDEAFETTKQFHKDLEEFFNSYNFQLPDKIYYERRSKQYANTPVKQIQKINLRILTQYFVGMFLNKPHQSFIHESILLKEFANVLYQPSQSRLPYFVAAYSFYQLEKLFREKNFFPEFKAYKSHLLMMFRESLAGPSPNLNVEKQIDDHSMKILSFLKNEKETVQRFNDLGGLLKSSMHSWEHELRRSRAGMRDVPDFTVHLLAQTRKQYSFKINELSKDEEFLYQGVVIRIRVDRYGKPYGFIQRFPDNIFFHSQQNKNLSFNMLEGKVVYYKIQSNPKDGRLLAIDVTRKT